MLIIRLRPWCLLPLVLTSLCFAADNASPVKQLKSFGAAGKELHVLAGGKEAELFHYSGHGCLTHMWFGGSWKGYDRTRIRVYVDSEPAASIDMELGLGVGIGFSDPAAPWGIARMGKTGQPSGIYNTFRIPFGKDVRVTAQIGQGITENPPFWWIIRGVENLPVTVAGVRLPDAARLHLYKLENHLAQPLEEFALCDTHSAGALYLVTIAARSQGNLNFLEAQMRAYIDGAREPMMLSSGLEDYFLGTYYFNRGRYYTPVAGLTHIDPKDSSFSAYRFHDDDPSVFHRGLRLTCRCGEKAKDHVFGDPKPTMYTTYAWVYEW
ncbi:MAG TPA: DUF2961 domain-containing protein [Tepidisphaeraceae bacterium]|nr:DUF2961 domain-containing protein [Tepidisphaeraceae bacterium]